MVFNKIDESYKKKYRDLKLDHLFKARPKKYNPSKPAPKKDLSRVVKWPKYIVTQRKKTILKKRLKIPPPVHQFSFTLNKKTKSSLKSLMDKYRPETPKEKKERLKDTAERQLKGEEIKTEKPFFLKFGLRHVTTLIEKKKAKLVVIAADTDPLEMVLFLPTLCRKMDVPYCIVKSKAELGTFVNQKKVTCVAFTDVRRGKEEAAFLQLVKVVRALYNEQEFKKWGGGEVGAKSKHKMQKLKKDVGAGK